MFQSHRFGGRPPRLLLPWHRPVCQREKKPEVSPPVLLPEVCQGRVRLSIDQLSELGRILAASCRYLAQQGKLGNFQKLKNLLAAPLFLLWEKLSSYGSVFFFSILELVPFLAFVSLCDPLKCAMGTEDKSHVWQQSLSCLSTHGTPVPVQ